MLNRSRKVLAYFASGVLLLTTLQIAAAQRLPVASNTRVLLSLETPLSSKESQRGDRFTARVLSPRAYNGAIVEGHISHLRESGRLEGKTEMGLEFDRIRLRDGRTAPFRAEVVELRQSEAVQVVDEEGTIHSGSRGSQAIRRTAIGAAVGGILGGLIGGRRGVAIGLLVGGAAGAGSLVVDGTKELKLDRGAELMVRTLPTRG